MFFLEKEVDQENNTQKMRVDGVKQPVSFYTLDVIISVGYRGKIKTRCGIPALGQFCTERIHHQGLCGKS